VNPRNRAAPHGGDSDDSRWCRDRISCDEAIVVVDPVRNGGDGGSRRHRLEIANGVGGPTTEKWNRERIEE
jgi:hypothetical protein